jgi:hypothetical protein
MDDRFPMSPPPEGESTLASQRVHRRHRSWLHEHSLSVVIGSIVMALLALYWRADPTTHLGSFYGNAAADWLGSFVTVVATKFWFERGSPESRVPSVLRGKGPRVCTNTPHGGAGADVDRVDLVVRANRPEWEGRPGRRQRRLRVESDPLTRVVHEVPHRTRLETKPRLAPVRRRALRVLAHAGDQQHHATSHCRNPQHRRRWSRAETQISHDDLRALVLHVGR